MDLERRAAVELRAGTGRRLEGYAAIFDHPTRVADFEEVVRPGAFARSLASGADVLALLDHDPHRVLARTRTGSLRLAEDSRGLHFATGELPGTSWANDAIELVRSGDAGGASFAFRVERDGQRWQGRRRELRQVQLVEISVVAAHPAYEGTSVQARSLVRPGPKVRLALRYMETLFR